MEFAVAVVVDMMFIASGLALWSLHHAWFLDGIGLFSAFGGCLNLVADSIFYRRGKSMAERLGIL